MNKLSKNKEDVTINGMTHVYIALLQLEGSKRGLDIPGSKYVIDDFIELPNGHYRLTVDLMEPVWAGERWMDVYVTPWSRLETVRRCVERMIRNEAASGPKRGVARADVEPGADLGKAARMAKRTSARH